MLRYNITQVDDAFLCMELSIESSIWLLQQLGINAEGVCKVSVNVVRNGVDYESLHRKFLKDTRGDDHERNYDCFECDQIP